MLLWLLLLLAAIIVVMVAVVVQGPAAAFGALICPETQSWTTTLSSSAESTSDRAVLNFSWGNFKVEICLQLLWLCNTHFSKGFIIWLQGHSRRIEVRVAANTKTVKTYTPRRTDSHTHTNVHTLTQRCPYTLYSYLTVHTHKREGVFMIKYKTEMQHYTCRLWLQAATWSFSVCIVEN